MFACCWRLSAGDGGGRLALSPAVAGPRWKPPPASGSPRGRPWRRCRRGRAGCSTCRRWLRVGYPLAALGAAVVVVAGPAVVGAGDLVVSAGLARQHVLDALVKLDLPLLNNYGAGGCRNTSQGNHLGLAVPPGSKLHFLFLLFSEFDIVSNRTECKNTIF